MRVATTLVCTLAILLLAGCSTTPKVATNADRSTTPAQVASAADRSYDKPLQWGGVIIESKNLADTTELQILAYPLEKDGRPDVSKSPSGRFIAQHPGYLETVDYRKGRQVTVTGTLADTREGKVGSAAYSFPVLKANQLVLWPREGGTAEKPRVNFGFGVGSGGRSWGGVGIGIGF
jgi:outer membrane lipoprotein